MTVSEEKKRRKKNLEHLNKVVNAIRLQALIRSKLTRIRVQTKISPTNSDAPPSSSSPVSLPSPEQEGSGKGSKINSPISKKYVLNDEAVVADHAFSSAEDDGIPYEICLVLPVQDSADSNSSHFTDMLSFRDAKASSNVTLSREDRVRQKYGPEGTEVVLKLLAAGMGRFDHF
jgi:hypothetical protein